jgi:hypothetical protein
MSKHFYILFFFLLIKNLSSQQDTSLKVKVTFNDGTHRNEINGKSVKLMNTLFVADRFGNPKSASFTHGSPGSFINLGTGSELKPEIGSISIWVKIEAAIASGTGYEYNPIILAKNGVLNEEGRNDDFFEAYTISYDYNAHKLVVASSQSEQLQVNIHGKDIIETNEWYHVVLTYDNDYLGFYVNGEFKSSLPKGFKTIFSPTDSVIIGHTANPKNSRYLCGTVDDILIYDRVLTAEEIAALYNAPDPNVFNYYYRFLKWVLVVGIVVAALIWLFLRKLKKDLTRQKNKNQVEARMNELETKAIRTQMNPHFIFNALNTLQRFILEEDTINANSYLIKFSKLLRKLLESSSSESISLYEEIDILKTYIEIEKLRFDKSFEVAVQCDVLEPKHIQIPFMLIQPFVENAIWHGLMPKKDDRVLNITFIDLDAKKLLCRIDDNGMGRKYSFKQKDPFKKKSMAIEFIKQRLEILEKVSGVSCSFKIVDKENSVGESEGTLVEIVIPKLG